LERRDHACPCCPGVSFGKKSNLKTHIKTVHDIHTVHEKRRDHACGYCKGVAFSAVHLEIKRSVKGAK
jgi:hypothetical protein